MAAPATAERRRPAAGTIAGTLRGAAPELRVEGEAEAAEEAEEAALLLAETDETGVVDVDEGVERVPDEEEALEVVDAAVVELLLVAPMENEPLVA